jgi:hypothetical protein
VVAQTTYFNGLKGKEHWEGREVAEHWQKLGKLLWTRQKYGGKYGPAAKEYATFAE